MIRSQDQDTIVAISTPPGHGGVSLIRVSGKKSVEFSRLCLPTLPQQVESHRAYFGEFQASNGDAVDQVLATVFLDGRSFTGEETVEVTCHGSPAIANAIVNQYIERGARSADRGEFTYRAFMNGKMDLMQAESVLALVEAQSESASKVALRQLEGHLSQKISHLDSELTWVLAHLEACIDFIEEGLEVSEIDELVTRAKAVVEQASDLASSYAVGKRLRHGLVVVLAGEVNAGKSSLLNSLLGMGRSIVSDQEGTTRDYVREVIDVNGHSITLVDTAGLRKADDAIETQGVELTKNLIKDSDLVVHVVDINKESSNTLDSDKPVWTVFNKVDLSDKAAKNEQKSGENTHFVSAKTNLGVEELRDSLGKWAADQLHAESFAILHARQSELLQKISVDLRKGLDLLMNRESVEFIAFEFQSALKSFKELQGEEIDEQVLDRVFKEFCIGK